MKLACFDIDGTLLPFGKRDFSPEDVSAVQSFLDAGNAVAIASGRPIQSCKWALDRFKGSARYLVAAGGALACDGEGVPFHRNFLTAGDYMHFKNELSSMEGVSVYCYAGDNSLASFFPESWADREMEVNLFSSHFDLREGLDVLADQGVAKIMIAAKPEISRLIRLAKEDFERYTIVRSAPHYLEVSAKGVSKASAIEAICREAGISKEDVYTFGDSGNDLEMIANFHGVAMGNATDEVKAAAQFVTKNCEECGVAFALREILRLI